MEEKSKRNLFRFNLGMGILHLLQFIAMLFLSNDTTAKLTTAFLDVSINFNEATGNTSVELITVIRDYAELLLGPVVASFLLISALAHFFIISPLYFNKYIKDLERGINFARWYEYAFSSSIMIVVIAILSGLYDVFGLLMLFVLNALMNLFGLLMEQMNIGAKKTNWTAYIYGVIAGITPWIVIAFYFYGTLDSVGAENVPDFVYWILVSLFVFFNSFAINMFLQYKKIGPWKNYLFGEKVYIFLSLIAKSLLAWQVFGGTLRPGA